MPWFASLLIGLAISLVAYIIMPKPQAEPPPEAEDLEAPTAEAGLPVPVLFGTKRIKGLNTLAFTDIRKKTQEVEG